MRFSSILVFNLAELQLSKLKLPLTSFSESSIAQQVPRAASVNSWATRRGKGQAVGKEIQTEAGMALSKTQREQGDVEKAQHTE